MKRNTMTLDEYITSVKEDIKSLKDEDTGLYGCCDMVEHEATLGIYENVLDNLKLIKEKGKL